MNFAPTPEQARAVAMHHQNALKLQIIHELIEEYAGAASIKDSYQAPSHTSRQSDTHAASHPTNERLHGNMVEPPISPLPSEVLFMHQTDAPEAQPEDEQPVELRKPVPAVNDVLKPEVNEVFAAQKMASTTDREFIRKHSFTKSSMIAIGLVMNPLTDVDILQRLATSNLGVAASIAAVRVADLQHVEAILLNMKPVPAESYCDKTMLDPLTVAVIRDMTKDYSLDRLSIQAGMGLVATVLAGEKREKLAA